MGLKIFEIQRPIKRRQEKRMRRNRFYQEFYHDTRTQSSTSYGFCLTFNRP